MTRIAIATDGTNVASHFGHCPSFTIVTLSNGTVVAEERIPNPGHRPGFLPGFLAQLGISAVIAGGIAASAITLFHGEGVKAITGFSGSIDDAVQGFLAGRLGNAAEPCGHEASEGHHCG